MRKAELCFIMLFDDDDYGYFIDPNLSHEAVEMFLSAMKEHNMYKNNPKLYMSKPRLYKVITEIPQGEESFPGIKRRYVNILESYWYDPGYNDENPIIILSTYDDNGIESPRRICEYTYSKDFKNNFYYSLNNGVEIEFPNGWKFRNNDFLYSVDDNVIYRYKDGEWIKN